MELCDDIDVGIEYIFSIYDGTFEKFVYHNTSATKHYASGITITLAEPVYVLKTSSDKYYKLRLSVWKVEGANSDAAGVYSMYFF